MCPKLCDNYINTERVMCVPRSLNFVAVAVS